MIDFLQPGVWLCTMMVLTMIVGLFYFIKLHSTVYRPRDRKKQSKITLWRYLRFMIPNQVSKRTISKSIILFRRNRTSARVPLAAGSC